jgi:hypothetical protein
MSIRHFVKTFAACGAATLCGVAFTLAVGAGPAGASLVSGDGYTTLNTVGTVTAGTPYSSGQSINVVTVANSTLNNAALVTAKVPGQTTGNATGNFYLEECTDPGGTTANLPTAPSNCEAATKDVSQSISLDGSLNDPDFTAYALPDPITLGSATMTGTCGEAPNYCVVGIFSVLPQSGGFSYPKLFSAPFQITKGDGLDLGDSPGDGTPEVPLAIGLPLAGLAVLGGGLAIRHRRRRQQQAA